MIDRIQLLREEIAELEESLAQDAVELDEWRAKLADPDTHPDWVPVLEGRLSHLLAEQEGIPGRIAQLQEELSRAKAVGLHR